MNEKDLIAFTKEVQKLWESGKITAPVHLTGGNEKQLVKLSKIINPEDWVLSTWRNHGAWLISGRDKDELLEQIKAGKSMHVCGERFLTSSIVGGIAPIAVGLALAIQKKKEDRKVICFLGDMASMTGIVQESIRYSTGHDLPILFVIEDNGLSVNSKTREVWGQNKNGKIVAYKYEREFPHSGSGVWVEW
jgi:TPP-dependent pyruvate/acetoin dehydrogenase alpha subunit